MSNGVAQVKVTIDGQEVTVPAKKEAYDALSKKKVLIDTTIYDAAIELSRKTGKPNPIPVLCHREHINPVAVCRVCTVDVGGWRLAPACYLPVSEGLKVQTAATSERVKTGVKVLTELLMADQPSNVAEGTSQVDVERPNELLRIAKEYGVLTSRFPKREVPKPRDDSSLVIAVDHNACILCDRCVRACNEIRDNQVISRAYKGYKAQIAFDLNAPMGKSSCVACGECMVSCPTTALTFRESVKPEMEKLVQGRFGKVTADDLAALPLFEGVSKKFLQWNEGAVVRRKFRRGEIICREGEYGSSAFLIEQGKVRVFISAPVKGVKDQAAKGGGMFGLLTRFTSILTDRRDETADDSGEYIHIDAPVALAKSNPVATLEAGDLFGEMTCMNAYPRSATVVAEEDTVVLEMLRNVLYILQRNKKSRDWLQQRYQKRTIDTHLRTVPLFARLLRNKEQFKEFVDYMRPRVELVRLTPGEVIFKQNDPAEHFYMVRVGFVKVSQERPGGTQVLNYIGPGGHFGEIALLSDLPEIAEMAPAGVRTATCTALDHVDVVRVKAEDFRFIVEKFPQVKQELVTMALERLKEDEESRRRIETVALGDFLQQGLMEAQSLLVLDLEKCTRCDECTKACSDSHMNVTRLVREGLRFDKWLVASSCRSCMDPYCLVGCPVDSIHRRGSREIRIENWCIGCGNCANNCPYGNINMHPFQEYREDPENPGKKVMAAVNKATMCDLCSDLDGQPSCVYACPHDAAHRMTGEDLRQRVLAERT
jgi:CRP-like cAMP-binding protein/Fe-S-cluster-containing dehydrogenase component